MIRVLLVDDHEMVRMGLSAYLSTQPDIEVIGEASNGEEGVQMALDLQPDVILMDLVMDKMNGIEATMALSQKMAQPKIIVLTSFVDDEKVYPALEAGAMSYILKTSKAPDIANAVRLAAQGQPVLEAKVTGKVLSKMRSGESNTPLHETLTNRELEVLCLIADGRSNQEIADQLYIALKTVKAHVTNILSKLEVDDRTQAAIYAHRNRLVD